MRKQTWNTFRAMGYSYDVAQDQRSAGGMHYHQIRWCPRGGGWQYRIMQSNMTAVAYGEVSPVTDAEGEAYYATAQQRHA